METLYLRNLNEKISINKLKTKLQALFSTYGTIIQITAHKNLKMKGQAFITYDSIEHAQNAINKLQNFMIFEKPVQIQFSRSNSDNLHRQRSAEEEIDKRKEKKSEREQVKNKRKQTEEENNNTPSSGLPTIPASFEPEPKRLKVEDWNSLPPNNVLLIQNLPATTTKESLDSVFDNKLGFINIRFVKIRNLAFIEFDDEDLSTEVLKSFDSTTITDVFSSDTILTYAKK